jgi:hypothetical protein
MATVVVLSEDAVNALIAGAVETADINGSGELVFTTHDGSVINVGVINDHGGLVGLGDDDHTEYALADGSRGAFATPAQGTKADDARPNLEADISINASGSDKWIERFTVVADGVDADTTWEDRVSCFWDDTIGGGNPIRVFSLNERFEPRYIPAKTNTTGLRGFTKRASGDTAHSSTVPIQQIMDNEDNRNNVWGILADGTTVIAAGLIHMAYVLVLGPSDTIPTGTPAGTVIVRTT